MSRTMAAMHAQLDGARSGSGTTADGPQLVEDAARPMRRLFSFLRPHRRLFWASTGASIANKVLDLMPPLLVGWVIDTVSRTPPAWIDSLVGVSDPWNTALFLAGLVVVIFFFESVFEWLYQLGFLSLAQKVQHDLRVAAYDRIQTRELEFFEEQRTGETMSMLGDDVNQLERFLNTGLSDLLQLGTLFVFATVVMLSISPDLAAIGLIPIPIIIAGSIVYQRLLSPRYRRVRETVGQLSSRLENNIAGISVIKAFTAERFEKQRVDDASATYRDANFAAIKLAAVYVPLIRMAVAVGFAAVLLLGSYWVLNDTGAITVGGLVIFSMLIQRVLWPLTRLGNVLNEYERANASARRTFGLLDTPTRLPDPASPVSFAPDKRPAGGRPVSGRYTPSASGEGGVPTRAKGRVVFDNVHFRYRRGDEVLKGLSFAVEPGEMIGIAGPTGAGKSTLIKLLLRMYDPTTNPAGDRGRDATADDAGQVRVDDLDVRDLSSHELRRNIALVSQDVYLFHGTIRENISYGHDDVPLDAVVQAAQLARLHDFVATLPDGYQTVAGERGIKLSGGQRQRLSIARAILKDAPILVLDEATSSVDTETERQIQQNLAKLAEGRTAIVIAHRLSTIRHATRILVLRDGRLAEQGTHADLITAGGTYADLWRIQSGESASPPAA